MAQHEEPVRGRSPKRPAGALRLQAPQAPTRDELRTGPAAQLAAIHNALQKGTILQLRPEGATRGFSSVPTTKPAGAVRSGSVIQRNGQDNRIGFELETATPTLNVAAPQANAPQIAVAAPLANPAPAMLEIVTGLQAASNAAERLGESEIKARIEVLRPLLEKLKKMAGSSAPPEHRRRGPPDGTT